MNRQPSYRIGAVYITATTPQDTDRRILELVEQRVPSYVCVSNMRTVTIANRDRGYREVMHQAAMSLPDGMPLVWMARLWGLNEVKRTTGPDLFVRMVSNRECDLKHFLLGDTEDTLRAVKAKFDVAEDPHIVGMISPPFCALDAYDYPAIAAQINASGADIVWLSLRAPKQDWMAARLMPYLDRALCIGVGAAFRFSLGAVKHPPQWVQKMGLTGLFWRKIDVYLLVSYIKSTWQMCRWSTDIVVSRLRGEKVD